MAREEQAMSAERLAEIRRVSDRFNGEAGSYAGSSHHPTRDSAMLGHAMPDMLAEVERQRAREAALMKRFDKAMAIVQMVANRWPLFSTDRVDELVTQARALLASAEADEQGEA